MKHHLKSALITLAAGAVIYYFTLPALNIHAPELLTFIGALALIYGVLWMLFARPLQGPIAVLMEDKKIKMERGIFKLVTMKIVLGIILASVAVGLIGSLIGARIFNAARYRELLSVREGDFTADVSQITYDDIPRLDLESARKLGDRKMGELADLVSQFSVMENYTQINLKGRPVRVTPLAYADLFKWMANVKQGVPGYLKIDMVTQEVELIRLEQGMKYSPAEHFGRYLGRHLRFRYPTKIFADETFEVDESGTPYWICPTYRFRIGLYGGRDIEGAVLVNAQTGEDAYYPVAEIPNWVDRVYNAELIVEQYNYFGTLVNGYWNSVFAQKDCRVTTDGYNYLALGDDVYMYTGVTSVAMDESNIGFILSNQRTKETTFYPVAGAEEFSAMNSAEGQVQEMRYTATFPLLLNINDEPTYFIALKDASQLVKMYAMVNVRQYQIVVAASTVEECEKKYKEKLLQQGVVETPAVPEQEETEVSGKILAVRSAVLGGNTVFYLTLEGTENTFALSMETDERAVTLATGQTITLKIPAAEEGEIRHVSELVSIG